MAGLRLLTVSRSSGNQNARYKLINSRHMTEPIKYYGTYADDFGTTDICIINDFKNLFLEINGVQFKGREFSDLAIINKHIYSDRQLERFTLIKTAIYNTDLIEETLCSCIFKVIVPQLIIDKEKCCELYSDLEIEYSLGDIRPMPTGGLEFEKVKISLVLDEKIYTGVSDFIEIAFDQIRNQFQGKYHFKNCYGCMFGDYSVFGQSSFGAMLCFVNQKDKYKEIATKSEYMKLAPADKQVQEIYLCNRYKIRKNGIGYRG